MNIGGSALSKLRGWQCNNRCSERYGITQNFPLDASGQILCTLVIAGTVEHICCDQSNPEKHPHSVVSTSSVVLLAVLVV